MIPANQQSSRIPDAEAEITELEGDHPDHQTDDKEGAEGQQIGHLTVNGNEADTIGNGFDAASIPTDLQHVAFIKHDVVIDRHFNLATDHAVEKTAVIGQLQLGQAAANGIVIFHHNLFSDDAHIEQIAIEHLFTITEAGIEAGMCIRITHGAISSPICSTASPSGLARMPLRRMRSM